VATFVHLTPEKSVAGVLRAGITLRRKRVGTSLGRRRDGPPRGVFAMPVTRNFYVSHQWLRDLKRGGQRTICGVYFRIPDAEPVWVGHYGQAHRDLSAAEAVALVVAAENPEGYEVIIPRSPPARWCVSGTCPRWSGGGTCRTPTSCASACVSFVTRRGRSSRAGRGRPGRRGRRGRGSDERAGNESRQVVGR
jgi:hypothetical protein